MVDRCLYNVLGISRNSSPEEIRSTYRRLALKLHPDKNAAANGGVTTPAATAAFQELLHAYKILSDPDERAYYDAHLSDPDERDYYDDESDPDESDYYDDEPDPDERDNYDDESDPDERDYYDDESDPDKPDYYEDDPDPDERDYYDDESDPDALDYYDNEPDPDYYDDEPYPDERDYYDDEPDYFVGESDPDERDYYDNEPDPDERDYYGPDPDKHDYYDDEFDPDERDYYNEESSYTSPFPFFNIDIFSFLTDSAFDGFTDSGLGFYRVYGDLFTKLHAFELQFGAASPAPSLGNLDSPYLHVEAFYKYWHSFSTVLNFGGKFTSNPMLNSLLEEKNKKAKNEHNNLVRSLAAFARKRDKRVIGICKEETSGGGGNRCDKKAKRRRMGDMQAKKKLEEEKQRE